MQLPGFYAFEVPAAICLGTTITCLSVYQCFYLLRRNQWISNALCTALGGVALICLDRTSGWKPGSGGMEYHIASHLKQWDEINVWFKVFWELLAGKPGLYAGWVVLACSILSIVLILRQDYVTTRQSGKVVASLLIAVLLGCISPVHVFAGSQSGDSGYYRDSQKGWWWGERTVEEEPEQKEEKKADPKKDEQEPWIPPALSAYKYDDVWNMHPDQFYELQEAYKKKAVQDPTYENTKDYYELSEIMRKKAAAFTNSSQYVWQKHPELTVAKDYPVNTPGNRARQESISEERTSVLRSNQNEFALIYFWKPGCPFCDEQKNILKWFESSTGWTIKHINILENPKLARKIGVTTVPSTILIKRGNKDHFPVSAGVITSVELQDKAYWAVRSLNKEISPEEYSTYGFQKGGGFDVNSRKDWVPYK